MLIYTVVLDSSVQESDLVIHTHTHTHIHMYILFQVIFHYRLIEDIE